MRPMTSPARVFPLLALAVFARAPQAAPATPPVLATKALRVELTGTADALWRFVPRSGAPAQSFAAPVFPLDGQPVTAALAGVARVGDPVVLPNFDVTEGGRAVGLAFLTAEHPVVREHWATPGTTVTFDARGRAVVDAAFERPGAAIVFFGAREP